MDARAILFTGINQVSVEAIQLPNLAPDEALVEVEYTCVSPGTELRCLRGQQPNMLPFPFIPGYASVGRVRALGAAAAPNIALGMPVFAGGTERANRGILWGGHVSHVIKAAHKLIPIPDSLDLREAALAKLAAIAYHGVRLSQPQPHETVCVVGLGIIGLLSARLHALSGARVCAFDLSAARVAQANGNGVEAFVAADGIRQTAAQVLPSGADIIVDATGVPSVLGEVISLARPLAWDDSPTRGTRLLIQGSYPSDVPLPYQAAFANEITFYVPRDSQPRDLVAVLDLLARGKLHLQDLIGTLNAPQAAESVYRSLQAGEVLTAIFDWTRA
jgi:2-desacetyl-2-hydroxyethyl bacteriochlorophyllide A dehydrogenase